MSRRNGGNVRRHAFKIPVFRRPKHGNARQQVRRDQRIRFAPHILSPQQMARAAQRERRDAHTIGEVARSLKANLLWS